MLQGKWSTSYEENTNKTRLVLVGILNFCLNSLVKEYERTKIFIDLNKAKKAFILLEN